MPRKGPAPRRELMPDPIYRSLLVTQIVNKVLLHGKRSTAEKIVYTALEQIEQKTGAEPISTLKRAIENVKPQLEVKSRRVGGATYQVPVEVRSPRNNTLAIRWVIGYSRQRREKTMAERLANELLDASPTASALRSSATKTCTRWRSRTRPTPTTAGSDPVPPKPRRPGRRARSFPVARELPWQTRSAPTPSNESATSASWPTSTRARPRRPSGSSTTRVATTRSARCTKAPRRWTGWRRSRSAASPSRRRPPPASGATTTSTSSTPPATSTSPSRWSARCACSTARSRCSTASPAWSRRPRRCGGRPTSTACPACASSTRWTASAPTSSPPSTPSRTASTPTSPSSSCRSARRATTRASSTS